MSANPYAGFGYHSGLVQSLAGQLQGEAQADEIARKQQQVEFNQAIAMNTYLANQEARKQADELRKNQDRRAQQSLDLQEKRQSAAAEKDAWWRGLQERKVNIAEGKATGKGGLTGAQQIAYRKQMEELDAAFAQVTNTPGGGQPDGPVTFNFQKQEVTLPRSQALDRIQQRKDALNRIYGQGAPADAAPADWLMPTKKATRAAVSAPTTPAGKVEASAATGVPDGFFTTGAAPFQSRWGKDAPKAVAPAKIDRKAAAAQLKALLAAGRHEEFVKLQRELLAMGVK